ncbi:hypothetical protein TS85_22540 [Sphingomonas hengshuiensis]|uniref:Uncharacterized protein n=1 Tax=Sphingomonas hengshuiensis TaxID=1609977 RepID=A0A7U5BEX4_9SPHN|nr:hypothetical protein TS85_22540 [Sphingomonas hengshuiensis]
MPTPGKGAGDYRWQERPKQNAGEEGADHRPQFSLALVIGQPRPHGNPVDAPDRLVQVGTGLVPLSLVVGAPIR